MMDTEMKTRQKCILCGKSFWIHFCLPLGYRAYHNCLKQSGDSGFRYHYNFDFTGPWRNTFTKAVCAIPRRMVTP